MKQIIFLLFTIFLATLLFSQNAPHVYNVTGSQRTDGSKIVDIYYNILEPDGDTLRVTLQVSDDDGTTFDIIPSDSLLSGDIGDGVLTGTGKHIIWNAGEETIIFEGTTYRFKVIADDDPVTDECVDYDGNVYQTVQIGDQLWMAENLKVTHYRNGDVIPNITNNSEWGGLSTGAYGVYGNNPSNADTYGNLYNWYAVDDSRNIAPVGWHVPTDEEIKELEMALGMSQSEADDTEGRGTNEGSKLAGNADLWNNGALENNAEFGTSGFSFLPGGYRDYSYGSYINMGRFGYFWSATESGAAYAWARSLNYSVTDVYRSASNEHYGFSVRCVRD